MSLTCHMCPAVQIILIWNWLKCLTFLKHPIAETEGSEGRLSHCLGKTPCVQQRMNIWLQDNNKSMPCQRAKAKYCNRFDNKAEPPPSLVLLRIVSFLPSFWIHASPLPLARVLQTSSQEQRFEHRISAPGDTTFLHSHETAHLERLNQKLVILTQKVPQDDESSFILLQTSWHHKLTEFPDSVWRCLQGYRQNLKNSEVWPKGFKNQKTKNT